MRIRAANPSDRDFILGLAPRLVECGVPPGRDPERMVERDRAVLAAALESTSPDTAVLIAEDDDATPLGFMHLTTAGDYYTATDPPHIADVVVTESAAGHGVGTALIAHAEDWAKQRGASMLTLHVFTTNHRARDLYARLGFQEEWIRCIKHL